HLRTLPPGIFDGLTEAEAAELARETADVLTNAQRLRRKLEAEAPASERWGFRVPRPAALLFDALAAEGLGIETPALGLDVTTAARARLGIGAEEAYAALRLMAAHELATVSGEVGRGASVTLHPEARSWF